MKCLRCAYENPPQAKFCQECGDRLAARCARCGTTLPAGARYCFECGQPAGPSPRPEVRFASPETYTPRHLAEKILTSRAALEGERKQVTVLFADMKGSMELLAERDPEDARRILDPVLELMMEAVHRYEGTVNQIMGDGIMALFGAPVAHEDHAVRGCYAAVRIQEVAKRYSEEMRRTEGVPIEVRVGLHSGEVVVRSIGSDFRMDYSAVGQTTHLAARMEQLARPGSILVTDETVKLAGPHVRVHPLGPVTLKGMDAATETYELQGIAPVYAGLQSVAVRSRTRFVGRTAELERLQRALDRAGRAYGQVVGVIGEPGVGKTRLFYEFTRSPSVQGWLVLATSATSYGRRTPYLPVVELLKAYFALEEEASAEAIRRQVAGKLLSVDPGMGPALPALTALLDVPVDDPDWMALDPRQRRERTLDALRHLVLRESQIQPVCLVVENLHWIDGETQAFLDQLVEGLPSHRVLLLVNYRPEYRHRWGAKTCYTEFRIDPLDRDSVETIVRDLLGADPDVDALKDLLVGTTEGNPFFLEECLRALVETRALVGRPGAYRLGAPVRSIRVPATVQAVLAARIDRLPTEEKALLQSAAVIGKTVSVAALQMLAPADVVHRTLAELQAAEFLYETRAAPDQEYTFKHALTHEVAYGSLLHDRRRDLHARLVAAMEGAGGDRSREQVERLAYHAFHGEVWDKAVTYLKEAGANAFAQAAHREAAERLTQALAALERLPGTRATSEQAIDLRLALRNALLPVGEVETVLRCLREAEALARSLEDQRRAGWISAYLSACFWSIGDYAAGLDAARQAHRAAVALGDVALQVYASTAHTWPYHSLGQYRAGIASAVEAIDLLAGSPGLERLDIPSRPAVLARTWLVSCLAEIGEFARAAPLAQEAVRLAEASGEPWSLVDAYLGTGILHLRRGEIAAATGILSRGLDVSRRFHIDVWFPPLASSLGHTLAVSGNLTEALALLERAALQAATTGLRFYHSLSVLWLAEAYRLAARGADARRRALEALALCDRYHEAGNRAYTLRVLGALAAEDGDGETAEQWFRESLRLGTELEMRPLAAHCHLDLGQLASRSGRWPEAREALTTAVELLDELEMKAWAERARGALQALPPSS